MKAAVYYGPHDIRVEDVAEPEIGSGGIVVKVKACGICGSDLHFYQRGGAKVKPGTIMGHEFSGDVVEVGKDVSAIKVGDRVAGTSLMLCGKCHWCLSGQYALCQDIGMGGFDFPGAYAQYAPVPLAVLGQTVFTLPSELSYEAGALMEPLGIGIFVAKRAEPSSDDIVIIFGAGMIGLSAIAAFRSAGVSRLIVSEIAPKRCRAALSIGADAVINPGIEDFMVRLLHETAGEGADIAVECTGLRKPFLQAMKILRIDGKLMQVGVFDTAFEFNPVTITTKNLRVIGCLGGDYSASMRLLSTGKIDANHFISHVFPLSGIREAFETQADTGVSIKVIIKP